MTVQVTGSWGTLNVDPQTGKVVSLTDEPSTYPLNSDGYRGITAVDVGEWRLYYPGQQFTGCDILDIGYWHPTGYEPPAQSWRNQS